MPPRKYQAAIFDMDGLLFDTESIGRWAWGKALESYGYAMSDTIYNDFIGRDMAWRERVLKGAFGAAFPFEAVKALRIKLGDTREVEQGLPIKPGVLEVLHTLQNFPIKIGLATGTIRERTLRRLIHAKIDKHFTTVVTSEDVVNGKPAPDIFLETSRRLDVAAKACVVFEDSSAGIKAAAAAGMLSIMVPDLEDPPKDIVRIPYRILPSLEHQTHLLNELFS
jgi:HAD superfamily hydrolase (TIGR01509 family)